MSSTLAASDAVAGRRHPSRRIGNGRPSTRARSIPRCAVAYSSQAVVAGLHVTLRVVFRSEDSVCVWR